MTSSSARSGNFPKTQKKTPYTANFEQKLIDNGIYPNNHASKPRNLEAVRAFQAIKRASLSPSRFNDEDFKDFQNILEAVDSESETVSQALPFIAGKHVKFGADHRFGNLEPFDKDLSMPKPDLYHGADASSIHPRVRADLEEHIIPSSNTCRPAAPNFFLEVKSTEGRPAVAKRQALYDAAVGARAMHSLQMYGATAPVYDNNAYSHSAYYIDGTLKMYAIHPTEPKEPGGKPEYHMTLVRTYAMDGDVESFRKGAAAYRNTRDLAKKQRDTFIDQANERARQMAAATRRISRGRPQAAELDSSEDDLALDQGTSLMLSGSISGARPNSIDQGERVAFRMPTTSPSTFRDPPSRSSLRRAIYETYEDELSLNETNAEKRPKRRLRLDTLSQDEPSANLLQSPGLQESGGCRQSRAIVEVFGERLLTEDTLGWRIRYDNEVVFVPDSRWMACEHHGRSGLYSAEYHVFLCPPVGYGRR